MDFTYFSAQTTHVAHMVLKQNLHINKTKHTNFVYQ